MCCRRVSPMAFKAMKRSGSGQQEVSAPSRDAASAGAETVSIVAVWSRDIDVAVRFGRINTAVQVRDALQDAGRLANWTLTNAFEGKRRIGSLCHAVWALLAELAAGRFLPLQTAMFAASVKRLLPAADWQDADVIYLDGIRTLLLLRGLRRMGLTQRIVVDLDDLMSRRFQTIRDLKLPISLGYMQNLLPPRLARLMAGGLARVIVRYERAALQAAESEVLRLANAVVMVNDAEADMLRSAGPCAGGDNRTE